MLPDNLVSQLSMDGVSRLFSIQVSDDGKADQGDVSQQVEKLVTDKLVREAQLRIHDPRFIEDYGVLKGAASDQSTTFQVFDVRNKPESPRRPDLTEIRFGGEVQLNLLAADGVVLEINDVCRPRRGGGVNTGYLVPLPYFNRFANQDVAAEIVLLKDPGFLDLL